MAMPVLMPMFMLMTMFIMSMFMLMTMLMSMFMSMLMAVMVFMSMAVIIMTMFMLSVYTSKFDEVHFGKFTNFFMQNKFFFDVHPPLGKLLFALTGGGTSDDDAVMDDDVVVVMDDGGCDDDAVMDDDDDGSGDGSEGGGCDDDDGSGDGREGGGTSDDDAVMDDDDGSGDGSEGGGCDDDAVMDDDDDGSGDGSEGGGCDDDAVMDDDAYVSGYDGNFSFDEIGQELGEYESFIWLLRFVPAFLGSLIAPCIYEIILEFGCTHWSAALGAFLVIFENMLIVQTRFMFIDGHLLFFTVASILCYLKFKKQSDSAFGLSWWTWLMLLGVSLVGACSTKYCGFMTLLVLGVVMGIDYWRMIGDSTTSAKDLFQHLSARAFCLGVVPLCLYLLQFYILFTLLYKTGPHDDMMSSAFQASLETLHYLVKKYFYAKGGLAKITHGQAQEVAYGSQITLRHTFGRQCWLHSHAHNYPIKYPDGRGSSHQQQVTCYSFKDVNNWWIVKDPKHDSLNVDFPPRPVHHGDIIQLVHGVSGRALNSHDVAAPLSPTNQEVSCYIDYNISMSAQNLWKVEVVNPDSSNKWRTIQSQIRFVHVNSTQAIKVTGLQLPEWGFQQFEVATDRVLNQQDTTWNVEEHQQNISYPEGHVPEEQNVATQNANHAPIPMPFLYKFLEIQFKMIRSNKELSGEHTFSSSPSHWPIMKRGVAYWIHKNKNVQIYCIGNPIVWWVSSLAVFAYGGILVLYLLRRRRAVYDIDQESWTNFCRVGHVSVIGYVLHFLPYFAMERTLFIHHYLPALLFKIVLLSVLVEHVHQRISKYRFLRYTLLAGCVLLCLAVVFTYHIFSPFTYGHIELSPEEINRRKWLPLWDMLSHPNT
ncbi:hypothetical protein QZH41_018466 [Actinostola sp. cb2023]|nr:hypothetical protein QZH41_018466 [Actinostola sp. cb2023]